MVCVDHKGRLPKRAEIQDRSRRLSTNAGQAFEPGQRLIHRKGLKYIKSERALAMCDRLKRPPFQPWGGFHIGGEGHA